MNKTELSDYPFIREASRLGAASEDLDTLLLLQSVSTLRPLVTKEQRTLKRFKLLVAGRGWPTEKIRVFLFDKEQVESLGNASYLLPHAVGPTAVFVPQHFYWGLGENFLLRIILHEAVHARSMGLPGEKIPDGVGLYALQEGLTEMIAEQILPFPGNIQKISSHLLLFREIAKKLVSKAQLRDDDIERISQSEAVLQISKNTQQTIEELNETIQEQIYRENLGNPSGNIWYNR